MKYVSVPEMQAIEREANASGFTYAEMMENAGRNLAETVDELYGFLAEEGALGLAGSGNNGGDTLVALTYLAQAGWKASATLVRPRPADDPLIERLKAAGGVIYFPDGEADIEELIRLLPQHGLLLDGVLGTGIRLPLKPEVASVLEAVRTQLAGMAEAPVVVAVDCPSGVDCDSGQAADECIPADTTVTMAAVKQGLLKFPANKLLGDLQVVGIGLPQDGENLQAWRAVNAFVVDEEWARRALPERPPDAHKGTFGACLIIAGSVNYTGAALLSGGAAYRSGAGLVTLAVAAPLHAALAGQFPEATWLPLADKGGWIAADAAEQAAAGLDRATSLLVGPGFGTEPETGQFIDRLLNLLNEKKPRDFPVVMDADGLKLVCRLPDWYRRLPAPAVLTPHPGEMSILTGLPTAEIQADRLGTARHFSHEWGHVVILKGAFTIIAAPDGRAAVIPIATPALARAGTGDVLAGLVAGLRAQGVAAFEAAAAGAWIHAQAGLFATETVGNPASVLAGDVLNGCIDVLNYLL